MNKAELLHQRVLRTLETYTLEKVERYFKNLNLSEEGRDLDYYRETHSQKTHPQGMYLYLGAIVKTTKPKNIVEIGADKGVSSLVMASELSNRGRVYSIDIRDGWEYVPKRKRNIVRIVGDSQDASLLKGVDLSTIKLWFIDGKHDDTTVSGEINTYSPYWEPGTVVLFDDLIYYQDTWDKLAYDKFASREIHGNNFGVVVI